METTHTYNLVSIFLIFASVLSSCYSTEESKCDCSQTILSCEDFPKDFIFGAASSSYQYEGAFNEDGKGQSMWDNFTHTNPAKILDHSRGDVAIDSYHRYKEDVKIAKDLNLDAYRISISWSRILPGGTVMTGVNQVGIDYYNSLINELLANGIEPFVTIFHFDIPQALQDAYGGFLSPRIVKDFVDFADILFQHFGDRVKFWITINEPWTFSIYGYEFGLFAPGRCTSSHGRFNCIGGDSATESYIVMHNQLLAHSAVVNLYRNKYKALQEGRIGIALASYWFVPYDEMNENREAKDRALDFMLGWILEPLTTGTYPESMRALVGNRLPRFSEEEMNETKGSFDFIGFNYYGAIYAFNKVNFSSFNFPMDSKVDIRGERNGKPIGKQGRNSSRIYIYPKGLREIVKYIRQKYNDPLIYITENGIDEATNDTTKVANGIKDEIRKEYIHDHLCCLRDSIKNKDANLKGYFVWSLMDNFEWSSGFSVRFGLNFVDFKDNLLKRYPKESALWFKSFLQKDQLSLSNYHNIQFNPCNFRN